MEFALLIQMCMYLCVGERERLKEVEHISAHPFQVQVKK